MKITQRQLQRLIKEAVDEQLREEPEVIFASSIRPNEWQMNQAARHFDSDRLWVVEVETVVRGEGVVDARFYVVLANDAEEAQTTIESDPDVRRAVGSVL